MNNGQLSESNRKVREVKVTVMERVFTTNTPFDSASRLETYLDTAADVDNGVMEVL